MRIYYLLFLFIIFFHLVPATTGYYTKWKLVFSFLLIFVYAAIREDYGRDYVTYKYFFEEIQKHGDIRSESSNIEIGYFFINKILPSHRSLLIILAMFTCFTYYWLFKNFIPPKYYAFAFALMAISGDKMLFFQLSGIRNAITINILALSIPLIEKRKLFWYLGLTVFAFFFHVSAIFFMPLAYFIATPHRFTKLSLSLWSILILTLFVASSTQIINLIEPYVNLYFSKYTVYIASAHERVYERSILMYGFVMLLILLSGKMILEKRYVHEYDNIILKMSLLFLTALILGVLDYRMSQYFAPFFIINTILVLKLEKNQIIKYTYVFSVLIFLCYSFFGVYLKNPNFPYEEYHTIFSSLL